MRLLARSSRYLCTLIVASAMSAAMLPASAPEFVRLDPSKTWVGVARVHLEVDELQFTEDGLSGDYRIRVPLKPSENDAGRILLAVDSMSQLQMAGNRLQGRAQSAYGKIHSLSCQILEDDRILVEVISDERTLSFKTRIRELR